MKFKVESYKLSVREQKLIEIEEGELGGWLFFVFWSWI